MIANSKPAIDIVDDAKPSIFSKKNIIPLIIISVVVIGLSALSLVLYVKWQGEKEDALNKSSEINSLILQVNDAKNNSNANEQLEKENAELKTEIETLNGDKAKLQENNTTLTTQNNELKAQNEELQAKVNGAS
jgi:predicted nuclease with TOPRIM domain